MSTTAQQLPDEPTTTEPNTPTANPPPRRREKQRSWPLMHNFTGQDAPRRREKQTSSSSHPLPSLPENEDPPIPRRVKQRSSSIYDRLPFFHRAESLEQFRFKTPRLVNRDLAFSQSSNKIQMMHVHRRKDLATLVRHNWFHVLLRMPTYKSLLLLLTIWTTTILIYAGLYHWIDSVNSKAQCSMGNLLVEGDELRDVPITFGAAFAFSLETCTTVGYGLAGGRNFYFEDCGLLQFIIYLQMVTSMLQNAFLFAFLYARVGKSENRAYQVLFSDKAVIRSDPLNKRIVLQMRVYDFDSRHPVVEAHIRMYALLKNCDIFTDGHPQLVPLRIVNPNDEMGSMLFTSIPTVVTHEVDCHSPLRFQASRDAQTMRLQTYNRLWRREVDSYICSNEDIVCPICGEGYGTHTRLRNHIKYNQIIERQEPNMPIGGTHLCLDPELDFPDPPLPTLAELKEKFPLQELIVVVEGIEPLVSGTFQALHSYLPEDIAWDARFAPCLESNEGEKFNYVDLDLFHNVEYLNEKKGDEEVGDGDGNNKKGGSTNAANGTEKETTDGANAEPNLRWRGA